MISEIRERMVRGAVWMVMFKMAERSLTLISTLVLVRVLAPEDFGIVAMAMSFIAVAELLSTFGFDLALIQNQNASELNYHTAWTCNVLLGVLITTLLVAAAAPIADFYSRPDVFWVVCALALGSTINGLENIGVVAFRKDLKFRSEFGFLLSKKLIGVLVVVPLALWLHSYWALIIGTLVARSGGTIISYIVHPFRPRLSLKGISELMVFSKWMFANSAIIFFKERATDIIVGNAHGPRALGLYTVSNEFSSLPHTELAAPINRALLPAFARIQDDRPGVQASFTSAIGMLALIVVPAAAGICVVAPNLVPVVLGAKWLDAVALMQVLPVAAGLVALHSPMCALLLAHGRPDSVAWSHVAYVAVLFGALFLLVPGHGALGAAYATLIAAVASTPAYLFMLRRQVGIRIAPILATVARPLAGSLIMVLVVRSIVPSATSDTGLWHALALFVAGVVLGALVYALAVITLWFLVRRPAGAETAVMERGWSVVRRWLPSQK